MVSLYNDCGSCIPPVLGLRQVANSKVEALTDLRGPSHFFRNLLGYLRPSYLNLIKCQIRVKLTSKSKRLWIGTRLYLV